MSEVHDKIIADKESKIVALDSRIKAKEDSLIALKDTLEKVSSSLRSTSNAITSGASMLEVAGDLAACVKRSSDRIDEIGNELVKKMRDTKSAVVFETNQLKQVASDARNFKESAHDLKTAVELINSIRPTIKELMNNPDELNVIKEIIHACQSTTKNRERSETCTDQQAGTTPNVQVG